MLDSFVICDLETTGLSPQEHEIIEIGMVRVENNRVTSTFQSLVRPKQKLPVSIRRLTGLDDSKLQKSPELTEVLPKAMNFLQGYPLVGYNVGFDKSFLEASAGPLENTAYDILELARILVPASSGYRLGKLCSFLGIENQSEHRALSDAMATFEVYKRLIAILQELDVKILIYLNIFLQHSGSSWAGCLSSMLGKTDAKVTDYIFFLPSPQEEQSVKQKSVCSEDLLSIFAPGGLLSRKLENYEYRPQQKEMVSAVTQALEEKKFLLMEAGTGTGKSLAYLIPLLHWAIKNEQRVLVATHTINLQEQLWEKEIPLLTRMLSWSFKSALVKGRQNYLCLHRWLSTLLAGNWSNQEAVFYARVLIWVTGTLTGDKAELNLNALEMEFWSQICASSEGCLGSRCKWFKKACYVTRARKAAESANLIVTNHSLLFSDLRLENRLLPEYGALVIDEAHHLEDVATEQLGFQVNWFMIKRWFGSLSKLLVRLKSLIPPDDFSLWQEILDDVKNIQQKTWQGLDVFFKALYDRVIYQNFSLRLKVSLRDPGYENLTLNWGELLDYLTKITHMLESWSTVNESWMRFYGEVYQHTAMGSELKKNLDFISSCKNESYVYWVEVLEENESVSLHAAPVQVGKIIYEQLFGQKDRIILSSATLTVEGSFQYFMERTGLGLVSDERLIKLIVDSPFCYDKQCLLLLAKDVPLPGEVQDDEYFETLLKNLSSLIEIVQGKMLVLFTSHRVLKETYRRLKNYCEETDIYLLGHNIDGSRSRLIQEFRTNDRAVLLGASSFWEGVDIPGKALSCVVIVKLPFGVPTVPVVEARLEELARQGKDGFRDYSLPQAIIRFKQGFGRLIRTMQDKGAVIVLDHRLISKRYGKKFLNSLPLNNFIRGNIEVIGNCITRWFNCD